MHSFFRGTLPVGWVVPGFPPRLPGPRIGKTHPPAPGASASSGSPSPSPAGRVRLVQTQTPNRVSTSAPGRHFRSGSASGP